MKDLLVKLYDLPPRRVLDVVDAQAGRGVTIRRAMAHEAGAASTFVRRHFGPAWAGECEAAFARSPITCFLAIEHSRVVGFACHEVVAKNVFGPTGVDERSRWKGVGSALLMASLQAMREEGYAYAIVGGAGPARFFERAVGATVIPGSHASLYPPPLVVEPVEPVLAPQPSGGPPPPPPIAPAAAPAGR